MKVCRRQSGFTLIELLLVMLIIGVLAAIVLARYWGVRERAFLASVQGDLRQVANQQELYFGKHLQYASSVASLVEFNPSPGVVVTVTAASTTGWAATATHPALDPRQCGVFFGDAAAAQAPPAQFVGTIACN